MPKNLAPVNDIQEKKETLGLFKEGLAAVLEMDQPEDFELIDDYNTTLMRIILTDEKFKKELAKILQDNQEKLTFKDFVLDNQPVRPTIANWLKDFFQQFGAEMYDSMKISRYLSSSKNVKLLDEDEKKRVKKLLKLYRNLKFFPQSMNGKVVGEWEIIPVEKEEKLTKTKVRAFPGDSRAVDYEVSEKMDRELEIIEKRIKDQEENKAPLAEKNANQPVGEGNNSQLDELKKMADQYPEGSLEKRAIEEEMKKITNS